MKGLFLSKKSKAQITMVDLLVVSVILIILFSVSIAMWNVSMIRIAEKEEKEDLEAVALALSDQLVKTPGLPEDWEKGVAKEYTADYYTVGLWHLNEGSGDVLYDSSIYGNSGTRYGASWKSAADCMFSFCLEFDGDDYVIIPHSSQYDNQNFTIELWINSKRTDDERVVINKDGQWRVKLLSDMRIDFYVAGVGSRQTQIPVPPGEWINLAFTVEKTETVAISIFFNGETVFKERGIAGTPQFSTSPIIIANLTAGIKGKIDEIRISNKARKILKTFDIKTLGLADDTHTLNRKKVEMFVNLNYQEAKKLIGYDFYFQLTNSTGQVVRINDIEAKIGILPTNAENIISTRRIALFENQTVFVDLKVWR